jgi:K+-transporting ATPase ATPase C chain
MRCRDILGHRLGPHIPPAFARLPMSQIAAARKLPEARVQTFVTSRIETRSLGLCGKPKVNVLLLNRDLYRSGAA